MKAHVLRSMLVVAVVCVASWTFFAGTSGASDPLVEKHTSGPATVDRGCEDANFAQPGNVDECNGGLDVAEQIAENSTSQTYGQFLVDGYSQSRKACLGAYNLCMSLGTREAICVAAFNVCGAGCQIDYLISSSIPGEGRRYYFCYGSD